MKCALKDGEMRKKYFWPINFIKLSKFVKSFLLKISMKFNIKIARVNSLPFSINNVISYKFKARGDEKPGPHAVTPIQEISHHIYLILSVVKLHN